jgi:hypothetical protein
MSCTFLLAVRRKTKQSRGNTLLVSVFSGPTSIFRVGRFFTHTATGPHARDQTTAEPTSHESSRTHDGPTRNATTDQFFCGVASLGRTLPGRSRSLARNFLDSRKKGSHGKGKEFRNNSAGLLLARGSARHRPYRPPTDVSRIATRPGACTHTRAQAFSRGVHPGPVLIFVRWRKRRSWLHAAQVHARH